MTTTGTPAQLRIEGLLDDLYGDRSTPELKAAFADLIVTAEDRNRTPEATTRPTADRPTAWLIAYPDHITGEHTPLRELGAFADTWLPSEVEGIHVLPCFPSSSDEGFSVMDYHAIDPAFGTWDDISALAEERHLMLDAVLNHASAQGVWFAAWRQGDPARAGFFRTENPDADLSDIVRAREHPLLTEFPTAGGPRWVWTTFSADQVDLDYRNPAVARAAAEVIVEYAAHGATAIRLDAVGFLWKEVGTPSIHLPQTHQLIQLLRAVLDATYPDVVLISETNVPHVENISYLGDGSVAEADLVYQFPLPPLTLHAFTTGDATILSSWLRSLEDLPDHVRFFNFLASHDGVGLRPLEGLVARDEVGELVTACLANGGLVNHRTGPDGRQTPYELNATWFDLIRGPTDGDDALARHLASHAVMLALAGEPAIYLQAMIAEPNDVGLAEQTGAARSINRTRFSSAELGERLSDPSTTTARSVAGIADMLAWRASTPLFGPSGGQRVLETGPDVIGIERFGTDSQSGDSQGASSRRASSQRARVFVNVTGREVHVEGLPGSRLVGFRVSTTDDGAQIGPWGTAWFLPVEAELASSSS
ncbi:MAG: alpha-amylase family glycosyl hydrolase [Acidimicrobiia bacterium]|nr:alpha-amylase family glycosyl hydrolase [Acidimicrobiia bacterium]